MWSRVQVSWDEVDGRMTCQLPPVMDGDQMGGREAHIDGMPDK